MVAITASLLLSGEAVAQETAGPLAQSLFAEGRALLEAKRYDEACPKLAESQSLEPAPGTLLNLALCYEGQGKLATAWSTFLRVRAEARRDGRPDRESIAAKHIVQLEPRLPRLLLTVSGENTPGLRVRVDGVTVGPAAWGTEIPVNPGTIDVVASATNKREHRIQVSLAEAEHRKVTVPKLDDEPAPPAPSPNRAGSEQAPEESDTGAAQRSAAYASAALGIAGIGVGTFFGLRARSQWSESNLRCPDGACDARGAELSRDALTSARLSNVSFGVGLLGLGVAGVLLFSGTSGNSPEPTVGLAILGASEVGVSATW